MAVHRLHKQKSLFDFPFKDTSPVRARYLWPKVSAYESFYFMHVLIWLGFQIAATHYEDRNT